MEDNKIDINSLIGLFLLGLIFMWFLFLNPEPTVNEIIDDELVEQVQDSLPEKSLDFAEVTLDTLSSEKNLDVATFNSYSKNGENLITVDAENFVVKFSTRGGQISFIQLKDHYNYLDNNVKLIDSNNSIFDLEFTLKNGQKLNTKDQIFTPVIKDSGSKKIISMKLSNDSDSVVYIEYLYTLDLDDFTIDLEIKSNEIKQISDTSKNYKLSWELEAFRNSKSISYENRYSYLTYYYDDDKIDYLSEGGDDDDEEQNVNWISYKQHFFSSILISKGAPFKNVEFQSMNKVHDNSIDTLYTKRYISKIPFEYNNSEFDNSLKFYFGPSKYSQLKTYNVGLEDSVYFGWGIFGYINKNVFVPLYSFLSGIFPFGIAIIIMTIIVRIALAPLLYKSYLSQAKMKILRPELNEINKKFKDNAMKRQQEMMNLYRKAGANPMSGCLPGLLQIPVFYALFMFFPSAFDLRQKSFLWADDLSSYDSILDLGFYIPFYGDHVSLFPILASISIFFYMKMTTGQQMASQPKPQEGMPDMTKMMKYMIYFAPIMMMVFFNNYSSGLSLYYFISNLLSIAIMFTIKNYILDEDKIRQQIQFNKSQPVKPPSRFQRRMQAIMDEAERQKKNKK
tara:strand:+ start:4058 stop:5920 length:1863 start_codon:yes stop_codon:yes gene_type:complete